MKTITIKTEPPYNLIIKKDSIDQLGELCSEALPKGKLCIITDENVEKLYYERASKSLMEAGYQVFKIVLPPGEKTKSLDSLGEIWEFLAENQFTRKDGLLALGGGVIGDLTGFAAATFLRGIKFIQVPTTLLAAVDSSVGGKTAINLKAGKNLAGNFWQPSLVVFDEGLMKTLDNKLIREGLAEIIKAGVIADSQLFHSVKNFADSETRDILGEIAGWVEASIKVKKHVVEIDEKDKGERQLLNFGHTIGHAIEACSHLQISHGEAVAIGMVICAKASKELGLSEEDCYGPIKELLEKLKFPLHLKYTASELANVALRDKKRQGEKITLVVPLRVGKAVLHSIPVDKLEYFIKAGM